VDCAPGHGQRVGPRQFYSVEVAPEFSAISAEGRTSVVHKCTDGNPRGRPKKTEQVIEIEAMARQYAPQAMEALVKIAMTGKSDSARVAASIAILDRAFGRPRQSLEAKNASNVQYFISDQPLTAEEWERDIAPEIENSPRNCACSRRHRICFRRVHQQIGTVRALSAPSLRH
jgi:hypothetical protein